MSAQLKKFSIENVLFMHIPGVSRSLFQFLKILTIILKSGAQNYFFVNVGFHFTFHYEIQAYVSKK